MLGGRPARRTLPSSFFVLCVTLLLLTDGKVSSAAPCAAPPKPVVDAASQRELGALNAQLQDMLTRFTELHPDVRALRRTIESKGTCASEPSVPAATVGEDCEPPGHTPSPAPPVGVDTPAKPPPEASTAAKPAMGDQVVINPEVTHQVMAGFGTNNRLWDDPHVSNAKSTVIPPAAQREILTRLYTDLGLTRVRPVIEPGIEPVNDNEDPFTFAWSKFDFRGRKNDDHVKFVKQAMPYGLRTFWPAPIALEPWMSASNPDEYVEWAMALLLRWRDLGLELPFYSPMNEPGNVAWHRSPGMSAVWMTEVVKRLGRRMRAEGLRTMLVVPDDINPTEAYKRAVPILEDPEARQYVGALAYHLYGGEERHKATMRDLALKYRIPIWMSEYSVSDYATYSGALRWAQLIDQLITVDGVSAVDFLFGFFGSYADRGAHSLVSIDFDGGVYCGYTLMPAYYLTGQYSRFVRPGYVRVDAHSRSPGIHVSAFKRPSEIVVVAINSTQVPRIVEFSVSGGAALQRVSSIRTSPTERWQELPAITPSGSRFGGLLPAESVTTFVARLADTSER